MNSNMRTSIQNSVGRFTMVVSLAILVWFLARHLPRVHAEEASVTEVEISESVASTELYTDANLEVEALPVVELLEDVTNQEVVDQESAVPSTPEDEPLEHENEISVEESLDVVEVVPLPEVETSQGPFVDVVEDEESQEDFQDVEDFFDFDQPVFEPFFAPYTPPALTTRNFTKQLEINHSALHRCSIEPFRIDVGGISRTSVDVVLSRSIEDDLLIEIGSLPKGINAFFTVNQEYSYVPSPEQNSISVTIENQDGSQNGNFMVPLFLTKQGDFGSTSVCQFNVVNI